MRDTYQSNRSQLNVQTILEQVISFTGLRKLDVFWQDIWIHEGMADGVGRCCVRDLGDSSLQAEDELVRYHGKYRSIECSILTVSIYNG